MVANRAIPATLVVGDKWSWMDGNLSAFSADGWSVRYVFRPLTGGPVVVVNGDSSSGVLIFEYGASLTADIAPGDYEWSAVATKDVDDDRAVTSTGRVTFRPDPTQASGDIRSENERILAAINARIEGRANKDADAYSIEGRSLTRTPIADLMRLQAVYIRRVRVERGGSAIQYRKAQF